MKTVYIVHGREWSPNHGWIAWLTRKLQEQGIVVHALSMPSPEAPEIESRVSHLSSSIVTHGPEVSIVWHSVWVQAILRWAEGLITDINFGQLICVAWWFDLAGLNEDELSIARSWLHIDAVNREKAASHFHDIKAIFSDDDPWVPVSNSIDFHEKLGAEVIMESGMGHIYRKDPEKWYERLLDVVVKTREKLWKIEEKQPMIRVIDRDGTELWSFPASKHESILDTAEKHGIDIGYSCRSGACFSCACHVQKWFQHVDIGKFGYPLVDVDEWDCLTCISGLMDEARGMEWDEIVIKKF